MPSQTLPADLEMTVATALAEDIGDGDITAALIPAEQTISAQIVAKECGILCGQAWANAVFKQIDERTSVDWQLDEGAAFEPSQVLAQISGFSRAILTAERTALNFLQTLSATATQTHQLMESIRHTNTTLLDTRKTLPGLRTAQNYAVRIGGASNHRMGLYDAYLIKENHIAACSGVKAAISKARQLSPGKVVEIEVQNLTELDQALDAGADIVMLDNFSLEDTSEAVQRTNGRAKLEASGGIEGQTLASIAETGVDYISIGALTKHCRAIDLSLLVI